jgi:hypothetical protein
MPSRRPPPSPEGYRPVDQRGRHGRGERDGQDDPDAADDGTDDLDRDDLARRGQQRVLAACSLPGSSSVPSASSTT